MKGARSLISLFRMVVFFNHLSNPSHLNCIIIKHVQLSLHKKTCENNMNRIFYQFHRAAVTTYKVGSLGQQNSFSSRGSKSKIKVSVEQCLSAGSNSEFFHTSQLSGGCRQSLVLLGFQLHCLCLYLSNGLLPCVFIFRFPS